MAGDSCSRTSPSSTGIKRPITRKRGGGTPRAIRRRGGPPNFLPATISPAASCAKLKRAAHLLTAVRSGERRVGKECRSRWSPDHLKKKKKNRKADQVSQAPGSKCV